MFLVQSSGASFIILFTRNLDHTSVVVNVFTFLLQDKSLEELIQDTVGCQEFYASAVFVDGQNLWNEIGSNLLGLSSQNTERKLAKFGSRIVEKKLSENHTWRKAVNHDFSSSFRLFVTLNTFIQFLYKTVCELGKSTLRSSIARVSRGAATLDSTSNSVKNVTSYSSLGPKKRTIVSEVEQSVWT